MVNRKVIGKDFSKIDVARVQINSAIEMLFSGIHPITVHTIASACYQLTRDLAKVANIEDYLKITDHIAEGKESEYWKFVNKAAGFSKHADKSPDEKFDGIDETVNDIFILMSIKLYNSLGHKLTPEMQAFIAWFASIDNAEVMPEVDSEFAKKINAARALSHADSFTREQILWVGSQILSNQKLKQKGSAQV